MTKLRKEAKDKGEDPAKATGNSNVALILKMPKPEAFAERFLTLARNHPKDPAALPV